MYKEKLRRFLSSALDIIVTIAKWVISIAVIYWVCLAFFGNESSNKSEAPTTQAVASYSYNADYDAGYDQGFEAGKESAARDLTMDGISILDINEKVIDHYGLSVSEAWGIVECYETEADHGELSWAEYQNALEAVRYTACLFPIW